MKEKFLGNYAQILLSQKKWAELALIQSEILKHGLAVNLDPGSLILDTFFRIEEYARAVR